MRRRVRPGPRWQSVLRDRPRAAGCPVRSCRCGCKVAWAVRTRQSSRVQVDAASPPPRRAERGGMPIQKQMTACFVRMVISLTTSQLSHTPCCQHPAQHLPTRIKKVSEQGGHLTRTHLPTWVGVAREVKLACGGGVGGSVSKISAGVVCNFALQAHTVRMKSTAAAPALPTPFGSIVQGTKHCAPHQACTSTAPHARTC